MEHSPSWENKSYSANQTIPNFMESKDSLPRSQNPTTGLRPEPNESSPQSHTIFL
jgi:hypothetical protein